MNLKQTWYRFQDYILLTKQKAEAGKSGVQSISETFFHHSCKVEYFFTFVFLVCFRF